MAENRSESSPYESRFGGGWLTPSQFIAEGMCDRLARKDKVVLQPRFWQTERWKRTFLLQLRHANSLLKLYSPDAVIRALRTPEGKKVYSLGAKWLDPLIQNEQGRLKQQTEARERATQEPPTPVPTAANEPPRPAFAPKPSLLSKLRDLD